MMSKEKFDEITELSDDIYNSFQHIAHSDSRTIAESLYNDGWRKQSDAEWISIEERLPDGSGKFLIIDEEGYMTTATWHPNYGWFIAVCNGTPVTHWMPLPEPPDMKGGE